MVRRFPNMSDRIIQSYNNVVGLEEAESWVGFKSHDQSVHLFIHPSMAPFVVGSIAKDLVFYPSHVCITVVKLVK